jgi:hypothetical protein
MTDIDRAYWCGAVVGAFSVLNTLILIGILFTPWPGWFLLAGIVLLIAPYTASVKFQRLKESGK